MVYDELHRLAILLKSVVRTSGLRVGELERSLDLGKGTLNRIFIGKIDLKLRHILLVLGAVGITPGQFFRLAYAAEGEASAGGEPNLAAQIIELIQTQGLSASRPEAPSRTTSPQDLDRHIEAVLRRMGIAPQPAGHGKRSQPAAASARGGRRRPPAPSSPAAPTANIAASASAATSRRQEAGSRPRRARKNA